MSCGVKPGPDAWRRGSVWPDARILRFVPPMSITRIDFGFGGSADGTGAPSTCVPLWAAAFGGFLRDFPLVGVSVAVGVGVSFAGRLDVTIEPQSIFPLGASEGRV